MKIKIIVGLILFSIVSFVTFQLFVGESSTVSRDLQVSATSVDSSKSKY